MKLGEKIASQRRRLGLSQEELAARLNVTRQAVSKWETGTSTPELETLVALARTFGVTTDYLLSVEEPEEPTDRPAQPAGEKPDPLERIPGFLEKLHRRYGWLGGVYLAISGAGFLGLGAMSRYMVSRMFSSPGIFGTAAVDPFIAQIAQNNPVYTTGGFIMIVGIVLIIAGILLALWLKKKK